MALPIKRIAAGLAAATALGLGSAFSLVDKFEGNVNTIYKDPLGVRTICRGTTSGPLITKGKATDGECDAATLKDLQVAAATVGACVEVPLTDGERNAWTSFAYNLGPGKRGVKDGMCVLKSGALPSHVRLLAAGKHRAACHMMAQWTMPGTSVHKGLVARRTAEMTLCLRDLPKEAL